MPDNSKLLDINIRYIIKKFVGTGYLSVMKKITFEVKITSCRRICVIA